MNDSTAYATPSLAFTKESGEGQIVGEGSIESNELMLAVKTTITWQGGVDFTMTPATSDTTGWRCS